MADTGTRVRGPGAGSTSSRTRAGRRKKTDWLPFALAGGAGLVFLAVVVWLFFGVGAQDTEPKQQVVQVQVFRPPPPPEDEPPPPPEELEQEEVDIPEPEAMPDMPDMPDMPPAESLGLDAEGVAGADGFGLAARRGGRGIGEGDANRWYAGQVDNRIRDLLARKDEARKGDYDRTVLLWIGIDGTLQDYRFLDSAGDPEVDAALDEVIASLGPLPRPPVGMPQPIRYRIETQ